MFMQFIFANTYINLDGNKIILNKSMIKHYNNLFNSIEYDYFNFSLIYNNSFNSIKIKHQSNKNKSNKIVCIFGVLVNEKGLQIEKSMLSWLLPEYDVYCIYQKYPGILYEYPALRFAQWFSLSYNISIILYIHTKGAFNQFKSQDQLIELWRKEFTGSRKFIYIHLIKDNLTDISCLFRSGTYTLFNANYISNRAFKLINTISIRTNRYDYEKLFKTEKTIIRVKGVLNDTIAWYEARRLIPIFLKYYKYNENLKKDKNNKKIINIIILIILIFLLKKKIN